MVRRALVSVCVTAVACVALVCVARPLPPREGAGSRQLRPEASSDSARWRLLAWLDEDGTYPADGLARARADVARRRAAARASLTAGIDRQQWTALGPTNAGGRVRALVIHPDTPATMLTAGVTGGIWKSTNSGASWTAVDDFLPTLSVSALVMRPGTPSTIFAGTGESFAGFVGDGIYISTDTGATWTQLSSTAATSTTNFQNVNRLAMSADGTVLLAATNAGLFRSVNQGSTWSQVLTPTALVPAAHSAQMLDVKFVPGSNTAVVASGTSRNVYRSTDGGATWTASTGLTLVTSGASIRTELGVSASVSSRVYAVTIDSGTLGQGRVYRSTDGGQSFTLVSSPGHGGTQGNYNNVVWVDPTDADRVVVGGIDLHRSTDGGVTFTQISRWENGSLSCDGGPTNCYSAHADHHVIVSHPGYNGTSNRIVYVGTDGGVYRTDDMTAAITTFPGSAFGSLVFTALNTGLGIAQFYGAAGDPVTGVIVGGTQDNGSLRYAPAGGTTFTSLLGGDGGFAAVDPVDSAITYVESTYLSIYRRGGGSGFIYGGNPLLGGCSKGSPYEITDACTQQANFIAPFVIDPANRDRLWAGGYSLWRTNDARATITSTTGPQWQAVKAPIDGSGKGISAIAVSTVSSDVVWVGHNSGDLFISTTATASTPSWTAVDGATLPNRMVTSVAPSPSDPQTAYVTFGGFANTNVWKTTNGGGTWTSIGAGLPALPVRAIAVHPTRAGRLYVGTDLGVFASEDDGATWSAPSEGPANTLVYQLIWMNSRLVAVTHGRGLFITATDGAPVITQPPDDRSISAGETTTFTVTATGTPTPTFQWQVSPAGTTTWTNLTNVAPYSGVTTATLTVTAAQESLHQYRYRVVATNTDGSANSQAATLLVSPPSYGAVGATPQQLQFVITKSGATIVAGTPAQTVSVVFSGLASAWTASTSESWIQITGGTGTGAGSLTVSITNPGDVIGSQTDLAGAVVVTAPLSSNGSVTIPIALRVNGTTAAPFGQVDTPAQNATGVQGAIGVTGWALDDVGVASVKIYRNCLSFDNPASCQTILAGTPQATSVVFIGDAAFLAGARPDVEAGYSTLPQPYRAGWGYLMLTPMLPHVTSELAFGGQGALTLYAVATDIEGNQTLLGRSADPASPAFSTPTSITMDNVSIAKPFGAIDTPGQGATVSGVLANFGWALTPDSNTTGGEGGDILIPTNGSTMTVFIDSVPVAQVTYNQCRGSVGNPVAGGVYCNDDVANIFGNTTPAAALTARSSNPTRHRNLDAGRSAIGSYAFNTATLTNGLHTIAWSVTDSSGRTEGIGSRFFNVLNSTSGLVSDTFTASGTRTSGIVSDTFPAETMPEVLDTTLRKRPADVRAPAWVLGFMAAGTDGVWGRTGFDLTQVWTALPVDVDGRRIVEITSGGRVELWLGAAAERGFLVANGTLRDLPPGATLRGAQFAWAPPVGYVGEYLLSFTRGGERVDVTVVVK